MNVELLHPLARLPTKGTPQSAGYDLYSVEAVTLGPGDRRCVSTGLRLELPSECYGRIAPRSGLSVEHGLTTLAGVVDRDYRGEICVILLNTGRYEVQLAAGTRIAQLILERCYLDVLVSETRSLSSTARQEGGFGSTGLL
jgi:dUTP pyrophosphatase